MNEDWKNRVKTMSEERHQAFVENKVYQSSGYLRVILPKSNRVIASLPFSSKEELLGLMLELEDTNVLVSIRHREWTESYTAIQMDQIEEVMADYGLLNCSQHVTTAFARIRFAMKRYAELMVLDQLNSHEIRQSYSDEAAHG